MRVKDKQGKTATQQNKSTTRQQKAPKKALFVATVDSHILAFHLPYLKMLQEMGYETHVATNGHEKIPYCNHRHTICMERSPFRANNLRAIKQMRGLLTKEHFDIIHCHTPMGGVVTRLAAKQTREHGTRVIYTAHGFHFYDGAPLVNWLLFYPVEKYLAKYTDTLITINQEDYNRAKQKFASRCHDIQYVPGVGLDTSKFDFKMTEKEKLQLRESLSLKKDDFVIIYPAELSKRKRQIWLINTLNDFLKQHPDVHLLLPGKDSLHGACQALCAKLQLDGQVHCIGFRDDIPKLLKISNMAVSSAKQEGLPVNLLEAIYSRLPIVASACRGNNDVVAGYVNGKLTRQDNARAFEKAVRLHYNIVKATEETPLTVAEDSATFDLQNVRPFYKRIYNPSIKVCITNAYSWRNKGDAAILLASIESLKNIYGKDTTFEILSFSPEEDSKHYSADSQVKGVYANILNPHPYPPTKIGKVYAACKMVLRIFKIESGMHLRRSSTIKKYPSLRALKMADIIIVCGGGFLGGDKVSSLLHLYQMHVNTFFHKPVYVMGTSIEPMKNAAMKTITKHVIRKMNFVFAREEITDSYLSSVLPPDRHACIPDMAFSLCLSGNCKPPQFIREIHAKKVVGITLRNCDFVGAKDKHYAREKYLNSVARLIEYYAPQGFKFVFIPQVITATRDDAAVAEDVRGRLPESIRSCFAIDKGDWTPYEIHAAVGYCDYFLGTRMHSNIFALSAHVPTVAIAYERKTNGIMDMVGMSDYVIDINAINSEDIIRIFDKMVKHDTSIRKHLQVKIPEIQNDIITTLMAHLTEKP